MVSHTVYLLVRLMAFACHEYDVAIFREGDSGSDSLTPITDTQHLMI